MALRTARLLMALAARPERCPSARTRESPPWGRSIISKVSPLSLVAYFPTLATATWISMNPPGQL